MKFVKLSIILLWVIMIGILIKKESSVSLTPGPSGALKEGEEWMGIYFRGNKIGYVSSYIKREGERYRVVEKTVMILKIMGESQKILIFTNSLVNPDLSLISVDFILSSNLVFFKAKGMVNKNEIILNIKSAKEERKEKIPINEPVYLTSNIKYYLLNKGLDVGKRYHLPFFDPSTMSIDRILIEVLGKEKIKLRGIYYDSYKLRKSFKGIETYSWIGESGEILREVSAEGFTMEAEPKEVALKGIKDIDIITLTAIPSNVFIESPRNIKHMKIKLLNISLDDFNINGRRQRLKDDLLEINTENIKSIKGYKLPYRGKYEDYLKPSALIQSDNERIIKKAKEIIGDEKNSVKAAKLILKWVYKYLEKRPTVSIPNALEVLDMGYGDCNEHTALFTALARAAGIPTKMLVGIVYFNRSFFYHSWAEIYIGDWVSVDPVFNQFPADATHIKLIEGELSEQLKISKLIGKVKVKVINYN
jgi:hypothetical protein